MPKSGRGCQTRNNISHQILATAPVLEARRRHCNRSRRAEFLVAQALLPVRFLRLNKSALARVPVLLNLLPCQGPSAISDFRRAAATSAATPAGCANTFATSDPSYPMAASWR